MQDRGLHLILVNLGTPAECTPAAVRAFLDEFLSDPAVVDLPRWLWRPILTGIVLRTRPPRVAEQYRSIWTPAGSPLRVSTEQLAASAQAAAANGMTVSAAYRYGEPSLDTVLSRLPANHGGRIVVLPLFPQRTEATTGTAFRRAREAAARAGVGARLVERLVAPDDEGYVAALVARFQEVSGDAGAPTDHLVVSFHGIPVRYDRREGGIYTRDCRATYEAVLAALGWPRERATLAYQSKFGPEPWLTPGTAEVLAALPSSGVRHVAVMTPGFVTPGLETLEEIGIRGREMFLGAGGTSLTLVPAVGVHERFVEAIVRAASG